MEYLQERNKQIALFVANLPSKDVRHIFATIRKNKPLHGENYLLSNGITIGEFCTCYLLNSDNKRKRKSWRDDSDH